MGRSRQVFAGKAVFDCFAKGTRTRYAREFQGEKKVCTLRQIPYKNNIPRPVRVVDYLFSISVIFILINILLGIITTKLINPA